jgi:hypothetical protein
MTDFPINQTESSNSNKYNHIPLAARLINSVVSTIICVIGIYHLTQPNQAWRSGTIELSCALLLLAAAYRVSHVKAVVMNLVVSGALCPLGIRHLIHGNGWASGITELVFTVLLVTAASMVYRAKKTARI